MWYRVRQDFKHIDQRGKPIELVRGQLVDVLSRQSAERLLRQGAIVPQMFSFQSALQYANAAHEAAVTKRVGIWLSTSANYSGGRIHMFQYAIALSRLGVEVMLITQGHPRWALDYDEPGAVKILQMGADPIPPDIDIIVTDSKTMLGARALDYKLQHPHVPFVCMNFETPNWVKQYCPAYAKALAAPSTFKQFHKADMLLANSAESLKWCIEYLGGHKGLSAVLPPAVNTDALAKPAQTIKPQRPYAVWCGRGADFKQSDLAQKALWELNEPFDLMTFGSPRGITGDTDKHKVYPCQARSDFDKYALMQDAHMVLAPSLFEGFGMVPMEALASGTPCVVYDLPVLRQNYGDRLIYVPWNDKAAFKAQVAQIAHEPKRDMSAEQAWAASTYGLSAMQERVEHLPYHAMQHTSVTAHMICYGTPTAVAAVEAVYPHVDQIIIAYGPTAQWQDWPDGGVLTELQAMPDPGSKIQIEAREVWTDKQAMRQWCAQQATGNYMMMLDADEIWTGLEEWIEKPPAWGCPRWVNLWHGPGYWIHDHTKNLGRRWGFRLEPYGSVCPHYRWSWWRGSYYFEAHHTVVDVDRRPLVNVTSNMDAAILHPGAVVYHLGHALPVELMRAKHAYYERRDGADPGRVARRKAWHNWAGQIGETQDGIISEVTWELPEQVSRAFQSIAPVGVR